MKNNNAIVFLILSILTITCFVWVYVFVTNNNLTDPILEKPQIVKLANNEYNWQTIVRVRKDHASDSLTEVYKKPEIEEMYKRLTKELGESSVQLVEYDANNYGFIGFTIKLTSSGKEKLPNTPEEHTKFHSRTGYWLNYKELEYMGLDRVPESSDKFYECTTDDECVVVKADCCGCEAGGSSTSINIKYKSYWNEQKAKECSNTMCIYLYACEPSVKAMCKDKRCFLGEYVSDDIMGR